MTDAERLVARLAELGKTCGTAESCTGGGVGFAITAVPGASAVFLGGVVSYDNRVKRDVEMRIDMKFHSISALEEHMIDLVNEIKPRDMYEQYCREFHEYGRGEVRIGERGAKRD